MMKYGMESHSQQIQRKENFNRHLSLTKLHDFFFSTGVKENLMGFFFFSTAMVVIWISELFADQ